MFHQYMFQRETETIIGMKLFVSLLLFKVTVMDDLKAKNGHFNIFFTWNTVKLADLWLQMACFKDKNGPFILKNGQYFPVFFC